jgi:hypothetical protein
VPTPSPVQPLDDYCTLQELVATLRSDGPTVRRHIREGKIPAPDIDLSSQRKLWLRTRLKAWLAEKTASAAKGVSDALQTV